MAHVKSTRCMLELLVRAKKQGGKGPQRGADMAQERVRMRKEKLGQHMISKLKDRTG